MKIFSLIFLVCAFLAVTMSQPVPEETTPQPEILLERALRRPTIGEIADRFNSAVRLTVRDEREAISRLAQEIVAATRQIGTAGSAAVQAGLQAIVFLPELGRALLIDTKVLNRELERP